MAHQDIVALSREKHLVIRCVYAYLKGASKQRLYWYQDLPKLIAAGNLARVPNHPVLTIGEPRNDCPGRLP